MKIVELIIASVLLSCLSVSAYDFSGRVVGVSDGDTVTVLHDGRGEKIRLYGIDAPEKSQALGNRTKQFVSSLAFAKEVKVEAKPQAITEAFRKLTDRHRRVTLEKSPIQTLRSQWA
jgi:endonuclease YncB( thermonuclease family)